MGVENHADEELEENLVSRSLDPYEKILNKNTLFFSHLSPKAIFNKILSLLKDDDTTTEVDPKTWKLTFTRYYKLDEISE